jgi:hypothetical protein
MVDGGLLRLLRVLGFALGGLFTHQFVADVGTDRQ